ncbi:competence protein CoiA [Streptococcus cameli]
MLVALNEENQVTNLLERTASRKQNYRCPSCQGAVRLKQGQILRPHFAHVHLGDCHYHFENESQQHLDLKAKLFQWARRHHAVQVEAYLPAIQQVADLLVNQTLALEVQCSPLSIERLIERTLAYRGQQVSVLWLLGKKLWLQNRLTALQRQFLRFSQNMGFYLWELDSDKEVLRLRYLIHEDLHGKVQCLTREFPFFKGDLVQVLQTPYQAQKLSTLVAKTDSQLVSYVAKKLYYQDKKWLQLQGQAYAQGRNLLTQSVEDFYPQVSLPSRQTDFIQVQIDLTPVYQAFDAYYQRQTEKQKQLLYSPVFYLQKYQANLEESK